MQIIGVVKGFCEHIREVQRVEPCDLFNRAGSPIVLRAKVTWVKPGQIKELTLGDGILHEPVAIWGDRSLGWLAVVVENVGEAVFDGAPHLEAVTWYRDEGERIAGSEAEAMVINKGSGDRRWCATSVGAVAGRNVRGRGGLGSCGKQEMSIRESGAGRIEALNNEARL